MTTTRKLLGRYNDGNYSILLYDDGTKIRWSDKENRFVKEKQYTDEDDKYWMRDTYSAIIYDALKRKGISFEEFLFDPEYVMIIDGEEYSTFDTLVNSGFLDASRIEKVAK